MPPNLEKRTSWKLAVFHTLSCTLPKFSEVYQSLEFTGCSTFGTSFLASFCMKFSRIGVIWAPFGVQNGDFWGFGSIFSVYLETLGTIEAPNGKMIQICRLLGVPFGGGFQTFFSQKSCDKQKSCYSKPEGEAICKRHEKCRENIILEPWIWSSGCSESSIYTIP